MAYLALLGLASASLTTSPARAATSYEVVVGRFLQDGDYGAESMRFFPSNIRIHQGDTLHFNTKGFHGVTLLPVEVDPELWVSSNAGGLGKPYSMFLPDPDEGPDALKTNLRVLRPSASCGWPGQAACSFDGFDGEVLHSGLNLFPQGLDAEKKYLDFSVTINSVPGDTVTIVDPLHPAMRMSVEVVDAAATASDPGALTSASAVAFRTDQELAAKLHRTYSNKKTTKTIKGTVHRLAWAGVEQGTVSLRRFYPKTITIKPGQGVQWLFSENRYSSHTVTFSTAKGRGIANRFPEIGCDPDGDTPEGEPIADSAPTSSSAPYCTDPYQLELDVPRRFPYSLGDGKYLGGNDIASSGVRGVGVAVSKAPYNLRFPKPATGYSYVCMFHELAHADMRAKIVVKR